MGTSTSNKGGRSGSPFDPEWLAGDIDTGGNADGSNGGSDDESGVSGLPSSEDPADNTTQVDSNNSDNGEASFLAPERRFAPARLKMSGYLRGAGRDALHAAAQSMIRKGMGGPRRAASTMRRTAQGAGQLAQFLAAARDGSDAQVTDWVQRVRSTGLSASDLILEIVRQVLPDIGSVDDDSLRNAAVDALGKLYESNIDVDIFDLTDQQIFDVIGYVVANDVCNRMDLQLGQTYERLKHSPQEIQMYRNDMKEWVHEEVRSVMDQYRNVRLDPLKLASKVLGSAMEVFAE
jgi:hypothetical protein